MENAIKMTAQLFRCRNAVRQLLGDEFAEHMAVYASGIRAMGELHKVDTMGAAIELCKKADNEVEAMCILAAAVEMLAPSKAPAQP